MTTPQPDEAQPKVVPAPTTAELRKQATIWLVLFLAAVVAFVVGNFLATTGTTRTTFCLGSWTKCEAIETTDLGRFGIFLQWTMPIAALVLGAFWWGARGIWTESRDADLKKQSEG